MVRVLRAASVVLLCQRSEMIINWAKYVEGGCAYVYHAFCPNALLFRTRSKKYKNTRRILLQPDVQRSLSLYGTRWAASIRPCVPCRSPQWLRLRSRMHAWKRQAPVHFRGARARPCLFSSSSTSTELLPIRENRRRRTKDGTTRWQTPN